MVKIKEILSKNQIQKLVDNFTIEESDSEAKRERKKKFQLMLKASINFGWRVSELVNATIGWINFY